MPKPLDFEAFGPDAEEVIARAKVVLARVERMEFTTASKHVPEEAATALAALYAALVLVLPVIPLPLVMQIVGRFYEEFAGLVAERIFERMRQDVLLRTGPTSGSVN